MDVKYKPQLAVNLTKNYSELLRNFVADSHNHDVCVRNIMCIYTKNTTLPNSLVHSTTFENYVLTIGGMWVVVSSL